MVLFSSSSRSGYVDKQQLPLGESMQIIILFALLLLLILLLPFSVINLVEQQQQQKERRGFHMGTFTFRDLIKTNDLLSPGLQLQTKDDLIYRAMLCGLVEGRVEGPPCSDLCFLSPTPSCIAITLPYHLRHSHLPCCCCADLIVEF